MQHEDGADYRTRIEDRGRQTSWFRRISADTGLQGKLVLSFMFLLVVTLGAAIRIRHDDGAAGMWSELIGPLRSLSGPNRSSEIS